MSTISVSLPSDGSTGTTSQYNTPITTIVNAINGGLDNANIAAAAGIDGSKLASGSVTASQLNFGGSGAGIWWQEIGRTTLSVAGDTISITGITAKKYLKILISVNATGGTVGVSMRFNNDSAANYARRDNSNGGADGSGGSVTEMLAPGTGAYPYYVEWDVINIATQEKLAIGHGIQQNTAGAGNVPNRTEIANKWINTADQITRVDVINPGTGDFTIGSEVIVLGHN